MKATRVKAVRRRRRKLRVRKKVFGTPERPRLTVTRSLRNISVQLIDDLAGKTLVSVSSLDKDLRGDVGYGGNKGAAAKIGAQLAAKAKQAGITQIAFDRNGYKYHGRLKALADAAREGGLSF
jgi:large subunit ribosomal protein L18